MEAAGDAGACYTAGSVVGAVFGTLLTVLVLAGLAYLFWRFYWRRRRGKHLSLETGDRGGLTVQGTGPLGDRFAFDNPCFLSEDSSPNRKNKKGTPKIKADRTPTGKVEKIAKSEKGGGAGRLGKWTSWSPIGALVGGGGTNSKHNEKRRAFDDSFIGEPERVSVSLRGHDFTGLGFNVCGNMRDGIFVRDVLHRGPASESGQIAAGDRIVSLGISFEHMVFEDALTILSYASPYEVLLQVEKGASPPGSTLLAGTDINSGQTSLKRSTASTAPTGTGTGFSPDKQRTIICHPFYRSQSIDDLDKIGKASINAKRAQQIAEMTRIKSNIQDDSNQGNVKGTTEVDGRVQVKAAEVEEEKMQRRDAPAAIPLAPSASEEDVKREGDAGTHHTGFPKFGVRVLPPTMGNVNAEKTQGMLKAHNPGHNPSATGGRQDRAEDVSIIIATPEPQKQNERNSMIEMGVGKDVKMEEPHNPAERNLQEKSPNNPTGNAHMKDREGLASKSNMTEIEESDKDKNPSEIKNASYNENKLEESREKITVQEFDLVKGEGMITDVPEEVCMAAMAAVTNRKAGAYGSGHVSKNLEDMTSTEVKRPVRTRNISGDSGSGSEDGERVQGGTPGGNGGKRRAPAPPPEPNERDNESNVPVTVTTSDITDMEEPAISDTQNEERKKKGGTRIELGLDHITIHHQPTASSQNDDMGSTITETNECVPKESTSKDSLTDESLITAQEENSSDVEVDDSPTAKRPVNSVSGGKAASLGDLSRLEGGEVHRPPRMRSGPSSGTGGVEGVVLERAVSLDLGNAEEVVVGPPPTTATGSAKKRKAPAPPTPVSHGNSIGSDEIDGGSRVDTGLDGDEYGKEPRLIGVGTTDTFGRRLKKSSDWGTMEEALLAGGSPSSSSTSSSTSAGRTILHLGSVPSFLPSSLSTSDTSAHEFGAIAAEVSTTRAEEETREVGDSMVSMLRKIKSSHPEISLQSSVITSSDTDADTNATVTSTTEMSQKIEEPLNPSVGMDTNRVIVTTSTSIEEVVDSTTFPSQQTNRGKRGIVHLEVTDDTANDFIGGEIIKAGVTGDSFQSSFQRAREFFEREEDNVGAIAMEDEDDEVTSSPPSLPTSPMPTMQSGSPLSLHSTTTYISSIEDIPVVPGGLHDPGEFEVTTHNTPGVQHHITEIQVRSVGEDGKTIETRELVVSQDNEQSFGRIGDMKSGNLERNSPGSSEMKFSVSPVKIPRSEGEVPSKMYISDSFPVTDNARAIHRIGYTLTGQLANISDFQNNEIANKSIDKDSIESPTHITAMLGSTSQHIEENGSRTDHISSSEIIGESGNPTVQIRMREGPSGWIPYRQKNIQAEEISDERKENIDVRSEGPRVPKKKPPVPPRKDASNSSASDSPNRSDSNVDGSYSSNVKTVVEVPVSFTKRLVQVHETRGDEGMETRHGQLMHRVSEREVIQITPQELDKVMMSHSQFLSHKRGDSPSKSEQWLPGTSPTRTVVHRIVEQWVTDDEGKSKLLTEASSIDGGESSAEVVGSESGTITPPNGIVSTVTEGTGIEATPESRRQNMSVTRILVDPEFGTGMGRTSDGVAKTMMVANLQLSGMEGKTSMPTSGLHT